MWAYCIYFFFVDGEEIKDFFAAYNCHPLWNLSYPIF